MSGQIADSVKQTLKDQGLWPRFLERRNELRESGMPPKQATEYALAEMQNGYPVTDAQGPQLPIAPAALAGKTASEAVVVRWVFNHIDDSSTTADDCPSPGAWTLLRQCREAPGFCTMFIKDIWTKLLPSRAQLEDTAGGDDRGDGRVTQALIARIQAAGEKANRDCGVEQVGAR
ncbi:MAG: hypothetical protein HN742_15040 [Lentisphaerae bacterium]|mgnify:CR=1 FL=1|jgi:hypothetical protein|nr:hypothetical protein [Lentisphaerota bacterium]MBT5609578.1 hypothetical protein [Lentisphaerota bacterium]MBT7057774.1 hypothetical protein [Lentisphaerota bacterium]MBT7843193.1 hypothetical protein [Lentisphaerota bacterium]